MRIALATFRELPALAADERPVLGELGARGVEAVPAVWDDEGMDWGSFDLVVVRSTWDYIDRPQRFLAWARSVPRLRNRADVLAWNVDKHYLADLATAGVRTVPTMFGAPGEPLALPRADELVVKPVVSAGSRHTARHRDRARASEHVAALHAEGHDVMVQPYLAGVEVRGETGLVYLGGRYSHAFRKGALLDALSAPRRQAEMAEDIAPRRPEPAERALADEVVEVVQERFGPLLYARVDLVPDDRGQPALLELEVTEPSLFLRTEPAAAARLAEAIIGAAADTPAG